jgi:hypothetical protein
MHGSYAAVALVVTILFAAVGTILRVELPPEPPVAGADPETTRAADLPPALLRLAERAQRGFGELAGLPRER